MKFFGGIYIRPYDKEQSIALRNWSISRIPYPDQGVLIIF